MKKSLILVGLLSIGYAHAQEGRVGINTVLPDATLTVKSLIGTSEHTKNFELENGASKKLVTVLDNGSFGIGVENPYADEVNINNRFRFSYNGRAWGVGIAAYTSGWARGYNFTSIDGDTNFGGFKAFGDNNTLNYFFIGSDYTDPIVNFVPSSKNIGMGVRNPTNKLHIVATENPLKLEGLQETSDASAKNLVVVDGVVKIGAAPADITSEADGVIGNEVLDATADRGLERSGNGDAGNPYTLGIKDGGVTGGMLANGSVTGEKLAPSSVDAGKIAPNAVTGDKIANATIGADKLNIPGQADQVLTYKNGGWVASALPAAPVEVDGIVGNEVTGVIENRGLVREGQGTQTSPYKVGLLPGTKVGQTLVWNGSAWEAKEATPASEGTFTRNFREDRGTTVTITEDDYFVLMTGEPLQINLPTPSASNKGKTVCMLNAGSTIASVSPNPIGQQNSVQGSQTACFISSGTQWVNSSGY